MRVQITPLAVAVALAVPAAGAVSCKDQEDTAEQTRKVVDETRDEAAETRADIQDKQEELAREPGPNASDRAKFIAATEKTLEHLDRQIQEARAEVQKRAPELRGEARREMNQRLTDLENARAEAQTAFDRFRQATADESARVQQQTAVSLERARAAHDELRGRVNNQDEDPDMRGIDEEPIEAPPPPSSTEVENK